MDDSAGYSICSDSDLVDTRYGSNQFCTDRDGDLYRVARLRVFVDWILPLGLFSPRFGFRDRRVLLLL